MKALVVIIVCLVATVVGIGAAYYTPAASTDVIVLHDVTDSIIAKPDSAQLIAFLNASHKWDGISFTLSSISDVSISKTQKVFIPAQSRWLGNEIKRSRDLKAFYNSVEELLARSSGDVIGREQTSVYIPIVTSLTSFAESPSNKKVLIVYSDLMENTNEVSFYDPHTLSELKSKPEAVMVGLGASMHLPSLAGVDVVFVFQPNNTSEDHAYRIVSGFYKSILEKAGAQVIITSNLSAL
ncbi:MAG TPA: hypothetical protein PKN75_14500 [Bacteroidia bacterium]|nr:hypothetical protein [Bacteroidia bacterium]